MIVVLILHTRFFSIESTDDVFHFILLQQSPTKKLRTCIIKSQQSINQLSIMIILSKSTKQGKRKPTLTLPHYNLTLRFRSSAFTMWFGRFVISQLSFLQQSSFAPSLWPRRVCLLLDWPFSQQCLNWPFFPCLCCFVHRLCHQCVHLQELPFAVEIRRLASTILIFDPIMVLFSEVFGKVANSFKPDNLLNGM